MQITAEKRVVESNIDNVVSFGVKDPALIFDMLCSKLYKNPIRTMVQEYMCNARDAHREIGSNEPIEVTLPTALSECLVIRDYGPGISPERMENVFIFLGESTKRSDDLQTGGFGIGAKIGWAYTESFTIVSITGNVRREYLAFLGDGGIGKLVLVSESITDQRQGVAIQIKIKKNDFHKVEEAVNRACYFWPVQPIVHNRSESYTPYGKIHDENDLVFVSIPGNVYADRSVVAVVDGIIYLVSDIHTYIPELVIKYGQNKMPVLFFQTGDVDLAVNRESVRWTKRTIEAAKFVFNTYIEELDAEIKSVVESVHVPGVNFSDVVKQLSTIMFQNLERNFKFTIFDDLLVLKAGGSSAICSCVFGQDNSKARKNNCFVATSDRMIQTGVKITSRKFSTDGVYCNKNIVIVHSSSATMSQASRVSISEFLKKNQVHDCYVICLDNKEDCEKLWSIGFNKPEAVERKISIRPAANKEDTVRLFKSMNTVPYSELNSSDYCFIRYSEIGEFDRWADGVVSMPGAGLFKILLCTKVNEHIISKHNILHLTDVIDKMCMYYVLKSYNSTIIDKSKVYDIICLKSSVDIQSVYKECDDLLSFIRYMPHSDIQKLFTIDSLFFEYCKCYVLNDSLLRFSRNQEGRSSGNKYLFNVFIEKHQNLRSVKYHKKIQRITQARIHTLYKQLNKKYSLLSCFCSDAYSIVRNAEQIADVFAYIVAKSSKEDVL